MSEMNHFTFNPPLPPACLRLPLLASGWLLGSAAPERAQPLAAPLAWRPGRVSALLPRSLRAVSTGLEHQAADGWHLKAA